MSGDHPIQVRLKEDDMEDFKKAIAPMKMSEYFRQHQEDIVAEYRKKKEHPEDKITRFFLPTDKAQATLDLFRLRKSEITTQVVKISDTKILIELRDKARQIKGLTETKLKKSA